MPPPEPIADGIVAEWARKMAGVEGGVLPIEFNAAYKEIRNQARKYTRRSIVDGLRAGLAAHSTTALEDLERMPSQALLLLKWVCQENTVSDRTGGAISGDQLHALRQMVHSIPARTKAIDQSTRPGRLFMRQLLHAQIGFQRRFTPGYIREAAILAAQPKSHPLRVLFKERTGLDINDFMDLGIATYAVIHDRKTTIANGWFQPLVQRYTRATLDAYIGLVSRDYSELISFFRSLPDAHGKRASDYFEFPVIKRFPFFRDDAGMHCWHPMIFYRGMEDLVHSVLSEAGEVYMKDFSKLFETHVVAETKTTNAPFLNEHEIASLLPQHTKVPDGLLSFPECNIFVEAKAGLFDESAMVVGHNLILTHKTRALKKAATQGWAASHGLRAAGRAAPQILNASTDYLLVVTNKELSASNGKTLTAMYPESHLEPIQPDALIKLPLENIFFVSVEDFERLIAAARNSEIYLPNVLAKCVADNADPARSAVYFEQHLTGQQVRLGRSSLVERALSTAGDRLASSFQ